MLILEAYICCMYKEYKNEDELDLTEDQLQQYYAVYKEPSVLHIRKALNAYLKGNINSRLISSAAVGKDIKNRSGLDCFSKKYYKSKFIVLSIENSIWGGVNVHIMFQDKSDKQFVAWVYKLAEGDYELRGFWEHQMDQESLKKHNRMFRKYLEDKKHAI
jgi:hypothetical protein